MSEENKNISNSTKTSSDGEEVKPGEINPATPGETIVAEAEQQTSFVSAVAGKSRKTDGVNKKRIPTRLNHYGKE
ncbi:MAG TPA: hypothetical protein VK489_14930 [Ferruginibacter sp.]|nr:hypothetical protein [Ferruginibacter sp.]